MLGDRATLLDAVKFFLVNHHHSGPPPKPIGFAEAAKSYHSFKVKSGKSDSHCGNILSRLTRLGKALPPDVKLDELTGGQLDTAVLSLGLAHKTHNEYRLILNNFFDWAAKQNPPLVSKGFNPAKDIERHKVKHHEVEYTTVADIRLILARLEEKRRDLSPLVVLVCFGALRPSEAVRLDWKDVGIDYIRLPGKKSKTGYSRQIPIQPNLKVWLNRWREPAGLVCPPISLPT
jgi:integrase